MDILYTNRDINTEEKNHVVEATSRQDDIGQFRELCGDREDEELDGGGLHQQGSRGPQASQRTAGQTYHPAAA